MTRRNPFPTALPFLPEKRSLRTLRQAAAECQGCDLYRNATQTVFGDGDPHAELMFVGEQPGNDEDLQGKPFVGPSGRLLRKAAAEAGLDPDRIYITNVVKHFRWEPRGKRRIHKKPSEAQMAACLPWLHAEIEQVRPRGLVCLGATAAQALLGKDFRVSRQRGELVTSPLAELVLATVHPSAILRAPDDETRALETRRFVEDLTVMARALRRGRPRAAEVHAPLR
ncbi:MAG: UdgX family uracil-DNA binding protein [Myxococcota bacterium]